MSYKVRKESMRKSLGKKKPNLNGVKMKPKLRNHKDYIEVKEIIVIYPKFKQTVLKAKFQVAFRRLFKIVMEIYNSTDTTEGDVFLALDEINKMQKILQSEYKHEIKMNEYHTMWKKTLLLKQKLEEKLILEREFRMQFDYIFEEKEKGIRR
mgnify:CR=1 FL=1